MHEKHYFRKESVNEVFRLKIDVEFDLNHQKDHNVYLSSYFYEI